MWGVTAHAQSTTSFPEPGAPSAPAGGSATPAVESAAPSQPQQVNAAAQNPPPAVGPQNAAVASPAPVSPAPANPTAAPVVEYAPGQSLPLRLPFEQGDPIPSGYSVEERYDKALTVGGGVVLGSAYLTAVVLAASSSESGQGWLMVPLIGPFAAIMKQETTCGDATSLQPVSTQDCVETVNAATRRTVVVLADGLLQVAGATMLVIGLATPERQLVLDSGVTLVPGVAGGDYGATLRGVF